MAYRVTRNLRFAWLEYEDVRDGIAFHKALTAYGWKNLFLDLAPATRSVNDTDFMDLGNPTLKIRWEEHPQQVGQTGLIATPNSDHEEFLKKWLLNPGVKNFRLTNENGADDYADLLALSGHGTNAGVFGDLVGQGAFARLQAGQAIHKYASIPSARRLKYLLIPACNDLHERYAMAWVEALNKADPLHGVLGYAEAYPGNNAGASIMTKFVRALHEQRDKPILQAWKDANDGWLWGAVMRKSSAEEDTLALWDSDKGLPAPSGPVLRFDYSRAGGLGVPPYPPKFEAVFLQPDRTPITWLNNTDWGVGLRQGEHWTLVVRRNDGNDFAAGDVVRVVFAHYRFTRGDMDLDTLLTFDASTAVTPVRNANTEKPKPFNGKVDGIDVKIQKAGKQIELGFTVKKDAGKHYEGEGNDYGQFVTRTFPPGANLQKPDDGFGSPDGPYLKKS